MLFLRSLICALILLMAAGAAAPAAAQAPPPLRLIGSYRYTGYTVFAMVYNGVCFDCRGKMKNAPRCERMCEGEYMPEENVVMPDYCVAAEGHPGECHAAH